MGDDTTANKAREIKNSENIKLIYTQAAKDPEQTTVFDGTPGGVYFVGPRSAGWIF